FPLPTASWKTSAFPMSAISGCCPRWSLSGELEESSPQPGIAKRHASLWSAALHHIAAEGRSLQLPIAGCRQRPLDRGLLCCSSAAARDGGMVVHVRSKATSLATDLSLRVLVRLLTMPTGKTNAAGMPRVHQVQRTTLLSRLVSELVAQWEVG